MTSHYYGGVQWDAMMARHKGNLDAGLIDWWVCYPLTHDQFLYAYCSFLLTMQPGKSFFYADANPNAPTWFPEYDIAIGNPVGKRFQKVDHLLSPAWLRYFEEGVAVVNPTASPYYLRLVDDYTDEDSVKGGLFVLMPKTGKILVRTL